MLQARTCAFCGDRDAVGEAELDGRMFAACRAHMDPEEEKKRREPVPKPGPAADCVFLRPAPRCLEPGEKTRISQIVSVLERNPGLTRTELAEAFGFPRTPGISKHSAYQVFARTLGDAVTRGRVKIVRVPRERGRYYPSAWRER